MVKDKDIKCVQRRKEGIIGQMFISKREKRETRNILRPGPRDPKNIQVLLCGHTAAYPTHLDYFLLCYPEKFFWKINGCIEVVATGPRK